MPVSNTISMTFAEAQQDMRQAYLSGAPGMLTSAAVWFAAGMVALSVPPERAIWTLFIGAAFIHPISVLLVKLLGRSGQHRKGNPLASLVFASTIWLITSCVIAYGASRFSMQWFFPCMLFVIGGRYLTFATLFGMRIYWACGLTLMLAAYGLLHFGMPPVVSAFTGATVEALFGVAILVLSSTWGRARFGAMAGEL